jgi:hypothetical protein
MKNTLTALIVVVLSFGAVAVVAPGAEDNKPPPKESSIWMQAKLLHAQKILAGLTKPDFDAIIEHAQAMTTLGYLEQWDNADRPAYKQELSHFDAVNKELIRQAKAKNIEGATLAYTQLTTSCVKCHSIVRDSKK